MDVSGNGTSCNTVRCPGRTQSNPEPGIFRSVGKVSDIDAREPVFGAGITSNRLAPVLQSR